MIHTIPYNKKTGLEYRGANVPALAGRGFRSLEWGTFLQWQELGYKILKGSKGSHIRTFIETTKTENGRAVVSLAPRSYVVFNREQVTAV